MTVKPFNKMEYAEKAVQFLSQEERIQLARKLCLSVNDPKCADALGVASLEILMHGENLGAGAPQRRSDGSIISPYAPDGGPLRPEFKVVS